MDADHDDVYDVLIVGGGVVGLSILRSATLFGWKCALVEAESDLLYWASGSNSGIVCTGVDASPGTLERALIRDSISRIRPHCQTHNIPMRPGGSLVCRWPWDEEEQGNDKHSLQDVLMESHEAGDEQARTLSAQEVQILEPNLSKQCLGAVHIPGEIVVDPWLFSIAYAVESRENGATIFVKWKLNPEQSSFDGNVWTAVRENDADEQNCSSQCQSIKAKAIVNCTGLFSDDIQAKVHGNNKTEIYPSWIAKPRRGQYRIFQGNSKTTITRPIQPIPTQRTKGIFVFGTIYNQICVGPTALDQESKSDRSVDAVVSKELSMLAKKVVPALDTTSSYVGDYVGLRPGTDKRDYQIYSSASMRWVAAAGIRSTGLTASLGIGRHVTHLLTSLLPQPEAPVRVKTSQLPPLALLIRQYHERGDGCVRLQDGNIYKVTHPITKLGWDAITDFGTIEQSTELSARSRL